MRVASTFSILALTAALLTFPAADIAIAKAPVAASAGISVAFDPSLSRPDSPIGQQEMGEVSLKIREAVMSRLAKEQIAYTSLNVWVVNLKPNRPTMTQMRLNPSLSYGSYGLGGAHFQAQMTLTDGRVLRVESQYFGHDIYMAKTATTWTDAEKATDWLAEELVKAAKSAA